MKSVEYLAVDKVRTCFQVSLFTSSRREKSYKKILVKMSTSISVEQVKSLLQSDSVAALEQVKTSLLLKLKKLPFVTQKKLYENLTLAKTVYRNKLVERDVPENIPDNAIALR